MSIESNYEPSLNSSGLAVPRLFDILENSSRLAFWRPPGWPGQWTFVQFEMDGIKFNCAEQAMMYKKSILFDDAETAKLILKAENPRKFKGLGRKVKNFNEKIWEENKFQIVVDVNFAKFSQNPLFKEVLLATGDKLLIEASPLDSIWGIGVDPEIAMKISIEEFKGTNLLGKALMETRKILKLADEKIK